MPSTTAVDETKIAKSVDDALIASQTYQQAIDAIEISDEASAKNAAEVAAEVIATYKKFDAERGDISLPLRQSAKKVDDLYRPVLTALDIAKKSLSAKIGAWQKHLREKAAEEKQKKIEAERAAQKAIEDKERADREAAKCDADDGAEIDAIMADHRAKSAQSTLADAVAVEPTESRASEWSGGAVQTRRIWKSVITDADQIPGAAVVGGKRFVLMVPDPGAITAYRRAHLKAFPPSDDVDRMEILPGVTFVREEGI